VATGSHRVSYPGRGHSDDSAEDPAAEAGPDRAGQANKMRNFTYLWSYITLRAHRKQRTAIGRVKGLQFSEPPGWQTSSKGVLLR
jgi:hypothetical protein